MAAAGAPPTGECPQERPGMSKKNNMKKHFQPFTLAVLYTRVPSDRQDLDLSVSA